MDALPGLRPAAPAPESQNGVSRERGPAEAGGSSERFEERLCAARDQMNGSSRAEDTALRARSSAAQERDPLAHDAGSAAVDGRTEQEPEFSSDPAAQSAKSPESGTEAQPQSAAKIDRAPAEAPAEPLQPTVEVEVPTAQEATQPGAATDPAQAAKPAAQPLPGGAPIAAAQTSSAQAPRTPPATQPSTINAASPKAILPEALSFDGKSAALAIDAPVSIDTPQTATAELQARANPNAASSAADFQGELATVRESLELRALQSSRSAAASESAAEILRQVRVGLSADLREAHIQLAPEALGRVSIRLRVEHGALTADVRAETSQALRALEFHAPELKAALAQMGVEPRSLAFSFMNSHAGDGPGRGHASQSRSPRAGISSADLAPVALERALARRLSASGVDTYA